MFICLYVCSFKFAKGIDIDMLKLVSFMSLQLLGKMASFWAQCFPQAMKEKVDQLHKRMYLQHDGLDKKARPCCLAQRRSRLNGIP